LNLQDAHLARALDELARLGAGDSQPSFSAMPTETEDEAENEIPQPIPEPIPIEVPIPPTPIAVNPPMQPGDDEPPPTVATQPTALAKATDQQLFAELAAMSTGPEPARPIDEESSEAPRPSPQPTRRPTSGGSLVNVIGAVALAFIAGMLFERFVKILESLRAPSPATGAVQPGVAEPEPAGQVTGRITYKSADGSSQPDRGARIIAFPMERKGEAKLSAMGFRPADSEDDAKLASAAMTALGGDSGKFQLNVQAGSYRLLVLSHFQPRDDKQPIDPELFKLLAIYFDKPDDVIGRVRVEFTTLRVKGTGDIWDHSF
jgi:hypothetical protein